MLYFEMSYQKSIYFTAPNELTIIIMHIIDGMLISKSEELSVIHVCYM